MGERTNPTDGQSDGMKTYECHDCGNRLRAEHHPVTCDECGGPMLDISLSRE
ncbi:MAG: rubrerythrin-like domain-containing protein [Halobacteriota archaeon]